MYPFLQQAAHRAEQFNKLSPVPAGSVIDLGDGRLLVVDTWRPRCDEMADESMLRVALTGTIVFKDGPAGGAEPPGDEFADLRDFDGRK